MYANNILLTRIRFPIPCIPTQAPKTISTQYNLLVLELAWRLGDERQLSPDPDEGGPQLDGPR